MRLCRMLETWISTYRIGSSCIYPHSVPCFQAQVSIHVTYCITTYRQGEFMLRITLPHTVKDQLLK